MKLVELMYNFMFVIYVVMFLNSTDKQVLEAALDHLTWNSPQRYIKGEFRPDIDLSELRVHIKILAELKQQYFVSNQLQKAKQKRTLDPEKEQ